jgi:hypothetical protein
MAAKTWAANFTFLQTQCPALFAQSLRVAQGAT